MHRFASSLAARSTLVAVLLSSLAPIGCAGGGRSPAKGPSSASYSSSYGGPGYAASESGATSSGDEGGAVAAPTTMEAPASGDSWGSTSTSTPTSAGATGTTTGAGVATPTAPPPPPPPVAKSPVPMADKSEAKPSAASDSVGASTTITTTTTIVVNPPVIPTLPPPAYPDDQGSPTGGILTAAIWDDSIMRSQFVTFLGRYPAFHQQWGLDLSKKITIVVDDSNGVAVGDAPISLRTPSGAIVNLRTHGDGTALFFPTASMQLPSYAPAPNGPNGQGKAQLQTTYALAAQVGTLRTETSFPIPAGDTTWTVKLTGVPVRAQTPALDVAVVLDTTGSMGDEISYLQNELVGVFKRVKKEQAMRRVRLGLVLYKDRGDDYVTKDFPFTEDLDVFLSELKQASAMGGGDMPESVNAALSDTVNNLQWAGDETGRVALLVADAPPHFYADEQYTYKQEIWDFAAKGIKIIPVAASGIDKGTEYVFRQMAAFTGGRYTFLTDDSGVGDSHLVPDITGYQVEHLDKILVRVIRDEANAFSR